MGVGGAKASAGGSGLLGMGVGGANASAGGSGLFGIGVGGANASAGGSGLFGIGVGGAKHGTVRAWLSNAPWTLSAALAVKPSTSREEQIRCFIVPDLLNNVPYFG